MSATGRSDVREVLDYYGTPPWATRAIFPKLAAELPTIGAHVLDPCAGAGAILNELADRRARWHGDFQLRGIEIDPGRWQACTDDGFPCHLANALTIEWDRPEAIIMNPPFSLAMEFVQKALAEVTKGGVVFALLRLAFLESLERVPFHRMHPSDVFVLPRRPSFLRPPKGHRDEQLELYGFGGEPGEGSSKGTDSTAYAWFSWGAGRGGRWSILEDIEAP